MALFDRETDPEKERNGVPLDFGDHRVTLARIGGANSRYELELERAVKPYRRIIAAGKLDKEKEREILIKTFVQTIVLKWETLASTLKELPPGTVVSEDGFVRGIDMRGQLVPDTQANLVAVYTALPDVYQDHNAAAKGDDLFRLDQREDDAGN